MSVMPLPKAPTPGQPLTASWGRDLVEYLRATRVLPGSNQSVQRTSNGTVVTVSPSSTYVAKWGQTQFDPFTLRWLPHSDEDPDEGEWQVYLPPGCLSGNDFVDYLPDMDKAKDANGNDITDWYKIADLPEELARTSEVTISGVRQMAKCWTVYLLSKPWPRMMVDADETAFDTVMDVRTVGVIGTVEYTYGSGESATTTKTHVVVSQVMTEAISITRDVTGAFALKYEMAKDHETERKAGHVVKCFNQHMVLGRLRVEIEEPTAVSGMENVCVVINHKNEDFTLEVKESDEASDDDKTVIKIYEMEDDVVTGDWRKDVDKIPFYNA